MRAILIWLTKWGIGFGAILLACGVATIWLGGSVSLPAVTVRDGTYVVLDRYFREAVPRIVLVGSSLTSRLRDEYFVTPGVFNLTVTGGSPLTGLEIVAGRPLLPAVILVEANVLSRPVDADLVERYAKAGRSRPWFFRPVRWAVASYERWNHGPESRARVAASLDALVRQPPDNFDNAIYLKRALNEFEADDPTERLQFNILLLKQLLDSVEKRGTRVLLFELPYEESLERARFAVISRRMVHEAFPEPDRWLHIDYPREELRWADGVHMDERSSILVSRLLERALSARLGSGS